MSELDDRIRRAARMIEILRRQPDSTVAHEAAKQLETILNGVLRAKRRGKAESVLLKRLEWAA